MLCLGIAYFLLFAFQAVEGFAFNGSDEAVLPGSFIVLPVVLTQQPESPSLKFVEIVLPEGWQLHSGDGLWTGQQELCAFTISDEAAPGSYELLFLLFDEERLLETASLRVTVARVRSFDSHWQPTAPEPLHRIEDPLTFSVELINQGNEQLAIDLEVAAAFDASRIVTEPACPLTLAAGERCLLQGVIFLNEEATPASAVARPLVLRWIESTSREPLQELVALIALLPNRLTLTTPPYIVEGYAAVKGFHAAGEWNGVGETYLYQRTDERLWSLFVRAPVRPSICGYDQEERLLLRFDSPQRLVEVGDFWCQGDLLAKQAQIGRGASFSRQLENGELSLFYQKSSLYHTHDQREVGVSYRQGLFSTMECQLYFLRKQIPKWLTSHIGAMTLHWYLPAATARAELSHDWHRRSQSATAASAAALSWKGAVNRRYAYGGEWLSSGKSYFGGMTNGLSVNLYCEGPSFCGSYFTASSSRTRQSLNGCQAGCPLLIAHRQDGLDLSWKVNACARAAMHLRAAGCRTEEYQSKTVQKGVWVGGDSLFFLKQMTVSCGCEFGRGRTPCSSRYATLQRYRASGTYSSERWFGSLVGEATNDAGKEEWRWDATAQLGYRYQREGSLSLRGQSSYYLPRRKWIHNVVGQLLHKCMSSSHTLVAEVGRYLYQDRIYPNEWRCFISYSVPIAQPITHRWLRERPTALSGTVSTPSGQPLPSALVTVDGRWQLLANSIGQFSVEGLPPGPHAISVEPHEMRTSTVRRTHELFLRQGELLSDSFETEGRGSIAGQVIRYQCGEGMDDYVAWLLEGRRSALKEVEAVVNLRVHLEHEESHERLSCITNQRGEFSCSDLTPGSWRLWLDEEELPKDALAEQESCFIDLQSGEVAKTTFSLIPLR